MVRDEHRMNTTYFVDNEQEPGERVDNFSDV